MVDDVQFEKNIRNNLNNLFIKDKVLTQTDALGRVQNLGYKISQSTFSRYIGGKTKVPYSFLFSLCDALGIPLQELAAETPTKPLKEYVYNKVRSFEDWINDDYLANFFRVITSEGFDVSAPNSSVAKYYSKYYCYFFSTDSSSDIIRQGILTIHNDVDSVIVPADFSYCGKDMNKPKKYVGFMIVAKEKKIAYFILASQVSNELMTISFNHRSEFENLKASCLGEALTISSGVHKIPTTNRIILSSKELKEEDVKFVSNHLYLNSKEILLQSDRVSDLLNNSDLSSCAKEIDSYFSSQEKVQYYQFEEKDLIGYLDKRVDDFKYNKPLEETLIATLKQLSTKQPYNKVSTKNDDSVFKLLKLLGYFS